MSKVSAFCQTALVVVMTLSLAPAGFATHFGPVVVYPANQGPVAATVDDANHDGILDLLVLNMGSNDLSVLIGNVDGRYQPAINYPVGLAPVAMTIQDFNGDGNDDVANSGDAWRRQSRKPRTIERFLVP
jgi:hypothetical protein